MKRHMCTLTNVLLNLIIFDSNLLFVNHIDKAVKKANQALGIIKRTFTFLNISVFISICKVLVRPHGNIIWYLHLKTVISS